MSKHADIDPGQKLLQVQKEYVKSVHYSQRYGALLQQQRPPLGHKLTAARGYH